MQYNFTNGNAEQKALWREGVTHLLNLPSDDIPVIVKVSFVPPAEVTNKGHTDLALTTFSYDSVEGETIVRNDAPGFGGQRASLEALAASMGLEYSAMKHFHETAVHELGHVIFASLAHETRVKIAQMFGASSDTVTELFPAAKKWENRIGEAIADTFKEAFLPRRYRVFPNRTNIHIPYSKFPEFRALFRELFEPGGSEEAGDEPGAWYRSKRQDAMRVGDINPFGSVSLPRVPPEKGLEHSGLYSLMSTVMNDHGEHPFPPAIQYVAFAGAFWIAVPEDLVEARVPIFVPAVNDPNYPILRTVDPEYPEVGNAQAVLDGEWKEIEEADEFALWVGGGGEGGNYTFAVELLIEDKEFHQYRVRWLVHIDYSSFILVHIEFQKPDVRLRQMQGWRASGTKIMHRIDAEGEHLVFEEDLGIVPGSIVDFSTSGLDIFHMAEAHGQSPKYRSTQAGYFMELREGWIRYENGRASTSQDLAEIWARMPQCWVSPLTFKPEEGEGQPINVQLPSGLLVPAGSTGAALPHRGQVHGTRA